MLGVSMLASFPKQKAEWEAADAARKWKPPAPHWTAPEPKPRRREPMLTGGYGSTLLTGTGGLAAGSQNVGTNTLLGK